MPGGTMNRSLMLPEQLPVSRDREKHPLPFLCRPTGNLCRPEYCRQRIGVVKGILSGRARVVQCPVELLVLFFRQIQLRRRIAVIYRYAQCCNVVRRRLLIIQQKRSVQIQDLDSGDTHRN